MANLHYRKGMDRAALLAVLETANRHIAEGNRHIERQREIVTRLEQHGRGTLQTATVARELLLSMERIQRAHLSHREQVRAELGSLDLARARSSVNDATDAERGCDTHIEVREKSESSSIPI